MMVEYCERWWLARSRPVNPIDAGDARRRHESRQPYAAVLGGFASPTVVVSLAGKMISIDFLDEQRRVYLQYEFTERRPLRLFLNLAIHRTYERVGKVEACVMLFSFKEDGTIEMERQDRRSGHTEERRVEASVDENWEAYPSFGNYLALCQEERIAFDEGELS